MIKVVKRLNALLINVRQSSNNSVDYYLIGEDILRKKVSSVPINILLVNGLSLRPENWLIISYGHTIQISLSNVIGMDVDNSSN